jgi:stearoyl-CoA desaturase (delta-9 desaturase)
MSYETIGLFSGLLDLPWWGDAIAALALTHVTIACVTIFLHRHQAHRALDLHPAASHFFRAWLWLTTGMVTREWVAVHRKHHAKCETLEDPHSPQVYGLSRVLWGGVFLYVRETRKPETLERYGQGTPDDWLERNLYSRVPIFGLVTMGAADLLVFGLVPGALVLLVQIVWIPFWAAGVINGIGHYWGYRHWPTEDASTNIVPLGVLIGGEELHNNHHAYPTSAKLSSKWYELDVGWLYIRALEALGLARVKHLAPVPHLVAPKAVADPQMLQAVIRNRYDVLARFAASLKGVRATELERMVQMRRELAALWERSAASREQLVRQLQDWCQRAEASGIAPLAELSRRLRCYA